MRQNLVYLGLFHHFTPNGSVWKLAAWSKPENACANACSISSSLSSKTCIFLRASSWGDRQPPTGAPFVQPLMPVLTALSGLWYLLLFIDNNFLILCSTTLFAGGIGYVLKGTQKPNGRNGGGGGKTVRDLTIRTDVPRAHGQEDAEGEEPSVSNLEEEPAMSPIFMEESVKGKSFKRFRLQAKGRQQTKLRLSKDFDELQWGGMVYHRKV